MHQGTPATSKAEKSLSASSEAEVPPRLDLNFRLSESEDEFLQCKAAYLLGFKEAIPGGQNNTLWVSCCPPCGLHPCHFSDHLGIRDDKTEVGSPPWCAQRRVSFPHPSPASPPPLLPGLEFPSIGYQPLALAGAEITALHAVVTRSPCPLVMW